MMWFNILSVSFLLNGCTTISSFHKKSNVVEIENHFAIELVEILRQKLYLHREQKESVIKRFFK